MENYTSIYSTNGEKCYFHINDLGEILEPVMIGNTHINVTEYEFKRGGQITLCGQMYREENDIDIVPPFNQIITSVIFSGSCTIVFWNDNTKTIVKLSKGDKPDKKAALLYAIAKKKYGTMTQVHKVIDPHAKSNAQCIAILSYIIANLGYDVDEILKHAVDYTSTKE